jgi:hypothetical protein
MSDGGQFTGNVPRRSAVDVAQHHNRQFVVGIVRQFRIEAFDAAAVFDHLVPARGLHLQAERIVRFEWRRHLL